MPQYDHLASIICSICACYSAGALKLVAEAFPWQSGSQFVYTRDNHNSVLGIREVAMDAGATAIAVDVQRDGQGG